MAGKTDRGYRPTESKYKGGAREMYVTYDLRQKTRGGNRKLYPRVKRVYIAGEVKDWETGNVKKRTGRSVRGVVIEYEQSRKGYRRRGSQVGRGQSDNTVAPAVVAGASQRFRQVVEIPENALNARFYQDARRLPERYRSALQNVR